MKHTLSFILLIFIKCSILTGQNLKTGADQLLSQWKKLEGKRLALVVNQTSVVGENSKHLVDTLLSKKLHIELIFAPEHGFRGTSDAGEKIENGIDSLTKLRIVSLYGKLKKPTTEQLKQVDIVIFDIQDVGARFYTYISTLYYVMEACAEQNKKLIVLDRPNPNDVIDGPMLQDSLRSFVGIVPIPLLYGLTVGELAQMINGESWLRYGKKCPLQIIKMNGWKHHQAYSLKIKPSPNLPNDQAIRLYPSLCPFEGTDVSIGRGTTIPFQVIGFPDSRMGKFSFTPTSLPGFEKNPLQNGLKCYGIDLRNEKIDIGFTLRYLIDFYIRSNRGSGFFINYKFFDQLMGTPLVRNMILEGRSENEIRQTWQNDLIAYKKIRKRYLLYKD